MAEDGSNLDPAAAPDAPSRRIAATLLLLAVAFALGAGPIAAQSKWKFWKRSAKPMDGTLIEIQGTLADGTGRSLPGVKVQMQGARRAFSYREFRRADYNPRELVTETDRSGAFDLGWTWHKYYNHFRVRALVDVPRGGGRVDEIVLYEVDLTPRMTGAPSVVVQMVVEDAEALEVLDRLRAFEAELDTEDEERIYRSQGLPEKIDRIDGPEVVEETWWYFDRGTAYRFVDGRYAELEEFDPVVEEEPAEK